MLSEKNYGELLKFRNTLVPHDRKLNEWEQALLGGGYIRIVYRRKTEHGEGYTVTRDLEFLTTTAAGEDALEEFEKHSDQKAKDKSAKRFDYVFQVLLALFSAVVGAAAGAIVEHWSGVVGIVFSFFA